MKGGQNKRKEAVSKGCIAVLINCYLMCKTILTLHI
jgi:hypothetical protein